MEVNDEEKHKQVEGPRNAIDKRIAELVRIVGVIEGRLF